MGECRLLIAELQFANSSNENSVAEANKRVASMKSRVSADVQHERNRPRAGGDDRKTTWRMRKDIKDFLDSNFVDESTADQALAAYFKVHTGKLQDMAKDVLPELFQEVVDAIAEHLNSRSLAIKVVGMTSRDASTTTCGTCSRSTSSRKRTCVMVWKAATSRLRSSPTWSCLHWLQCTS